MNIDINICKLTIKFLGRTIMNEQMNKEDECCKNSCCADGCCSDGCNSGDCSKTCCADACCSEKDSCC